MLSVCAAAQLRWLGIPRALAIALLSLEAGVPRHEGGLGSCLPLPCCLPSASVPETEGTWVPLSVPFATSLIAAEAGAALLWGRAWGREDNLLRTALLPRTLALGSETGGIGKPLILLLAALVWREQGD